MLLLASTLIRYPLLTPEIADIKVCPPTPDARTVLIVPSTCNFDNGLVVPMPTLPPDVMRIASLYTPATRFKNTISVPLFPTPKTALVPSSPIFNELLPPLKEADIFAMLFVTAPTTTNLPCVGEVVPIPTLPVLVILILSMPLVVILA